MTDFGFPYCFEGALGRFGVGRDRKVWYNVIFLPPELEARLPFAAYPRLRVEGKIADLPFAGAWIPTGDGRRYVIVAPRILKEAGLVVGDLAEMRFAIADQHAVDVPVELGVAIGGDDGAQAAWDALTPGKRRALAHRVAAAKGADTRARRMAEIIAVLTGPAAS